ncbi:hypothetical protein BpHYR1_025370 [Brachionus plicatilis]|uniref:Uncharacterized protein n=1 Tax=Brachionus plicatilis TaxID=10195 RepID=A0A3M7PV20_BRAPC|nr:hypothetical protein BpHYR1_025370 [Brachionus plicatilis]
MHLLLVYTCYDTIFLPSFILPILKLKNILIFAKSSLFIAFIETKIRRLRDKLRGGLCPWTQCTEVTMSLFSEVRKNMTIAKAFAVLIVTLTNEVNKSKNI